MGRPTNGARPGRTRAPGWVAAAGAALLLAASVSPAGAAPAPAPAAPVTAAADATVAEPGQLLVAFDPGLAPAARDALTLSLGGTVLRRIGPMAADLVALPPGLGTADAARRYGESGVVRFSQPNYLRAPGGRSTNDPLFEQQWALRNTGQAVGVEPLAPVTGTADVDTDASEPGSTPDAWEVTAGSPSVLVAVVDGGIQIEHPDLAANIYTNPGEVPGNGRDDDRNGFVDDVHGWDFSSEDGGDPYVSSSPSPGNPSDGCIRSEPAPGASWDDHGTHVAGIVGAVGNNNVGVAGVAWGVKVLPIKFLACDRGNDAAAIDAIYYAIEMGADVINASWGGAGGGLLEEEPLALREALTDARRAGITVVVAAGNGGSDWVGDNLARAPDYPASFDLPGEIVVAAGDSRDRRAPYSNYGGPTAIVAPGDRILSTVAGSWYGFQDGTSMAAPFVSGAAALLLSARPGLSPEQVKSILMATVDEVPAFESVARSGGRLNIGAALRRAVGTQPGGAVDGPSGGPSVPPAPPSYRLVASDGGIFSFGGASFEGSTGGTRLAQPIVAMASTPSGRGYWLVAADGGIFNFGDAAFLGSTGAIRLVSPIVGMAGTPTGRGYWLVAADGGIFAFGDAAFFGSTGHVRLSKPIVGIAATPSGRGYWLVASDGGIFAFGDATFSGSTGGMPLNRPIVAMARTPSGQGYWLVASDGGIFNFGDAAFHGSTGAIRLSRPIVAMGATSPGRGYWLVASDGGIFAFGDAPFLGSTGSIRLERPIVGMAPGA